MPQTDRTEEVEAMAMRLAGAYHGGETIAVCEWPESSRKAWMSVARAALEPSEGEREVICLLKEAEELADRCLERNYNPPLIGRNTRELADAIRTALAAYEGQGDEPRH